MSAKAEQVVPTLVGIVIFTFVMAFIISSLGPVDSLAADNIPANFNLAGAYDRFTPTYKIATPTNISANVFNTFSPKQLDFQRSVAPNDHLKGHVVRGNTWYVAGSINSYAKYKDFVDINFGYVSSGNPQCEYALPYASISAKMNSTDNNITFWSFVLTPVTSGQAGNYTLVVEVHHLANMTADLYANQMNLTLLSAHTVSTVSFWSAIGYLFTFNANWIPTYPWVALTLSAIIDLTVVLCIIRMVW